MGRAPDLLQDLLMGQHVTRGGGEEAQQIELALREPDLLAVALTAFAVVRAGPAWRDASLAGALGALAIVAKPTAVLPLAVVVLYLLWRERRTGIRFAVALVVALAATAVVAALRFSPGGMFTHVVTWNGLPYSIAQTGLLILAGMLTIGIVAILGLLHAEGRMRAYVVGAALVVLLGGREGATINYLLDLATASVLALAPVVASASAIVPLLLVTQLVVSAAAVALGVFAPDDLAVTRARVALSADLAHDAPQLAEDSGVLLAERIDPVVDDLFLWSRLTTLGLVEDDVHPRVSRGEIATVSADVPLDRMDTAPAYERLRWPRALVRAVLEHYVVDIARPGYHRYRPR